MNSGKTQRIHGIDALRAVAMLLGIVLHASIAYNVKTLPGWPHDAQFNSIGFDFVYDLIHSFRMALFFLIAGYFARMLYYKIGEQAFLKHRYKRIMIPFLFSIVLIVPVTLFPFSLYRFNSLNPGHWYESFKHALVQTFHWNGMAHLWFLYYLLIYYIAFVMLVRLKRTFIRNKVLSGYVSGIKKLCTIKLLVLCGVMIPIWLILMRVPELYLHVDTSVVPGASYILFYLVFFGLGWVMQMNPSIFGSITRFAWPLTLAGLALFVGIFYVSNYDSATYEKIFSFVKIAVTAEILLLVYGVLGLFLRHFKTESFLWKYISDAAFWMYLTHLGFIALFQFLAIEFNFPLLLRFPFVLLTTLLITLVTYQYFVRYTIIGEYLHGSRVKKNNIKSVPVQVLA